MRKMLKTTILENENYGLWFYPELKIIHIKFYKYCGWDIFREALEKGIEVFIQNGCKKWLSDDRELGIVSREDAAWSREIWYGKLSKAGWKYWALVRPTSTIGKISFKNSINKIEDNYMTMKIFQEPEEGLEWLKNVN